MDFSTRRRAAGLVVVACGALLLSGCGFDADTLQPYTPAQGINLQAGDVKLRNVLVVSDPSGTGYLSGSLVSSRDDQVTRITGTAHRMDNSLGAPLTVTAPLPIALKANVLTVLTSPSPMVQVSSPDLRPGQVVDLTLSFASGANAVLSTPIVAADNPNFSSITPTPTSPTPTPEPGAATPGASPSATPGANPSPTPTATPGR